MNRRKTLLAIPGLILSSAAPHAFGFKLDGMLGAAKDAAKAATLSDEEVRAYAAQMAVLSDAENRVAPPSDKYAKRLAALTSGIGDEKGLKLNYKVYLTEEVNAFAMADGTIRVFSGLMEAMTDDEVRYVIGHEIGHVQRGHSRKRMQTALATSATQQAAVSSGGKVATIAQSELGSLMTQVVRAQHSQGNEKEADDYALDFMKRYKYDRMAAVQALEKLDKMFGGGAKTDWLSTHPAPKERADRLRAQLA
ncbi:M48 family metallopeptidase [Aquabacterium sp. A7-Y]|uniref:M48 family metallopeptidase n=1 Tax=Aquabacterium sp. A7-Y TaxID=1349605 RepID=UPI00223D03FA|nr:M48 family metallopeptidase [Aquabacterium sp. A7-Y]MCW7540558.1 M48 family metallopeptidase [Aquabacterium sp. A7-Y]